MSISNVKFDDNGLIPCIVQDYLSKDVLMLAYMNEESIKKTLETRKTWFYSRSRKKLWNKGETSGNYQQVISISLDCDLDAVLIQVRPLGPSCHTGKNSCFFNSVLKGSDRTGTHDILDKLYLKILERRKYPKNGSYTNYLFDSGLDKILKKVGEESAETIIAAKNNSNSELVYEISDLIYHLSVLLVNQGVTLEDIYSELEKRYK